MPSPKELERICQLAGEVILGWGPIEVYWYLLFTSILEGTKREAIDAIYNYSEGSAAKRSLLLTVADAIYPPHPKSKRPHTKRKMMGALAARTNDLAGFRNAIAHAELVVHAGTRDGGYAVAPGFNTNKPNKFSGKSVIKELEAVIYKMNQLTLDLKDFSNSMLPYGSRLLPPELIEALHKQGLQVPSWAIPSPSPSPKVGGLKTQRPRRS